jgi:hypothetical protein
LIKKFDSEINLTQLLKNNKRYMNIGRNKNYKIVKTKDEVKSQSVENEDDDDANGGDSYAMKLKRFKKSKRIIKAYENMKIINDTYKSSLGLECPRFVRNFERHENREFYKDRDVNLAAILQANKNSVFDPEKQTKLKSSLKNETSFQISSTEFQASSRSSSPFNSFIKKKILLPKIF